MTSLLRSLAGVLLLFISLPLPAQETISLTAGPLDFQVPYHKSGGKEYVYGNLILKEMARDVLREPWLVKLHARGQLQLHVERDGSGMFLTVRLVDRRVEGDTAFRSFSVAGVQYPSHIRMTLRWANRADTSGYAEQPLSWQPVSAGDSAVCRVPVFLFDPAVDTLMVREVRMSYDSAAFVRFMEQVSLIHDYYASLSLLDTLQRIAAGMNTRDTAQLPYYCLKAWETSVVLNRIASRSFGGTLLAGGFDPRGFSNRYREAYRQSKTLTYNLIDAVEGSRGVSWDGDARRLAGYLTSRVLAYVRMSNLMDHLQGPVYQDCLDHLFDGEAAPPGPEVFIRLLEKMYPGAKADSLPRFFAGFVLDSYRRQAVSLIEGREYAQAWSVLDNGRKFAEMVGIEPDSDYSDRMTTAAEGVFNAYAGIARTCMERRQYEMADRYLEKASRYAAGQARYIRSDSLYRAVFSELFFMRNDDCDQLLGRKEYSVALECLRELELRYRPEDLAPVSEQLGNKMSQASLGLAEQSLGQTVKALREGSPDSAVTAFERAMALRLTSSLRTEVDDRLHDLVPGMSRIKSGKVAREAAEALEKRQYTLAVSRFREARLLASDGRFDPGRGFDSLYREAMKMYLVVRLYSARKVIWVNRFDSAQLALKATEQEAFDFGLGNDSVLNSAMDLFRSKIREQKCANLLDSAGLRMIRADRALALKNFTGARDAWQQALEFIASMPECVLPDQPCRDSLDKYNSAADWQQEESVIAALAVTGNYSGAIARFMANQQAFERNDLGRFGLKETGMIDFFRSHENPYLTWQGANHFLDKGDDRAALMCVRLAQEQGFPAGSAIPLLKELGRRIGKADFIESPAADPAQRFEKHLVSGRWFDPLRKAYLKGWNEQRNDSLKSRSELR